MVSSECKTSRDRVTSTSTCSRRYPSEVSSPAGVDGGTTSLGRTRTSASRSQPNELTLQRVDLRKVASGIVVAASLAAFESEATACVSVTDAVSAQVDDRREVLPLLQRGGRNAVAGEDPRHRAIQ